MAKRIYITHTDEVGTEEALWAVDLCLLHDIDPGSVYTLYNGVGVYYNEKTKNPSFQVWKIH